MNICRMLYVIAIVVMMSLILVWEQSQITKIGYRTSTLEKRKIDLIENNRKIGHEVDKLASGDRISQVINSFSFNLVYIHDNVNERDSKVRLFSHANIVNDSSVKEF